MTEPIHHLADTLQKLRKRIMQIRNRNKSIGEENTKTTLINPLLTALGWDLEELDEVCQEYRRKPQDNPVDYALFIFGNPRLLVEAKAIEKDLNDSKWISQTLGYATVVGVEWCVLTNGDEYHIYNSHAPVEVEEKLFRVVHISDSTQDAYTHETLSLLSKDKMGENIIKVLWKSQFIDRHVSTALQDIFRDEDKGLVNLIRKRTPAELKSSDIRESLRRASIQIDFPVVTAPSQAGEGRPVGEHGTYFDSITPYKWRRIYENIFDRRQLWKDFIERKRMGSDEFKKLSQFKRKAISGFIKFIKNSGIASESEGMFTLKDAVIPIIRRLVYEGPEAFYPSEYRDDSFEPALGSADPRTQQRIRESIRNRGQLWRLFIEEKRMTSERFKQLSDFRPKSIAGFMTMLVKNKIAYRFGDVFILNDAAVPYIQGLLMENKN